MFPFFLALYNGSQVSIVALWATCFSYWQGTIQASYGVMRQLLLILGIYCPLKNIGIDTIDHLSCVVRKSAFCICENKNADQLCGNHTAAVTTQLISAFVFRYIDSTISLLPKYDLLSL